MVLQRQEPAVGVRRQAKGLLRRRPVPDETEHLPTGLDDLHRALEDARGGRRQDRLGLDDELAAEAAALEGGDDADVLRRDAERVADLLLHEAYDLRRGPESEPIALPLGHRRVRLHSVMDLVGGPVDCLESHRCGRVGGRRVAPRRVGWLRVQENPGRFALVEMGVEVGLRRLGRIAHADALRRMLGGL